MPYPFATRTEAAMQIEDMVARYASSGYEKKPDYWWVRAKDGDRFRFLIETV